MQEGLPGWQEGVRATFGCIYKRAQTLILVGNFCAYVLGKAMFFAIKGITLSRNMSLGSAKSLPSCRSPDCNSDRNEAG